MADHELYGNIEVPAHLVAEEEATEAEDPAEAPSAPALQADMYAEAVQEQSDPVAAETTSASDDSPTPALPPRAPAPPQVLQPASGMSK